MRKKSRIIAVLLACVMMFGAVESACARTWGEWFTETTAGAVIGGLLGTAAVICTGGAALPLVAGGAVLGAAVGATPEDQRAGVAAGAVTGVAIDAMRQAPHH